MHRLALASMEIEDFGAVCARTVVAGVEAVCDPLGALYLPETRLLVVSDLHLEKGAAFARRGMMLPPYDTLATLKVLEAVIARHDPAIVVSLGDNFHDRIGSAHLPEIFRAVFVARVIEGMSVEETAEVLDIRPQTVKTRLHRARALVRKELDARIGPVMLDAFPFAGRRCDRLTAAVMERLGLAE